MAIVQRWQSNTCDLSAPAISIRLCSSWCLKTLLAQCALLTLQVRALFKLKFWIFPLTHTSGIMWLNTALWLVRTPRHGATNCSMDRSQTLSLSAEWVWPHEIKYYCATIYTSTNNWATPKSMPNNLISFCHLTCWWTSCTQGVKNNSYCYCACNVEKNINSIQISLQIKLSNCSERL